MLDISFDPQSMENFNRFSQEFPHINLDILESVSTSTGKYATKISKDWFKSNIALQSKYLDRATFKMTKSRKNNAVLGELNIKSDQLSVFNFDVNMTSPPRMKGVRMKDRQRVSYKLKRNGTTYDDTPYNVPHYSGKLFVQTTKKGHTSVFFRGGGKIKKQYAPRLQYFAHDKTFQNTVKSLSVARFQDDYKKEVQKITGIEL